MNLTIAPPADAWLWWQLVAAPLFVALCIFLGGLAWAAAVAASQWSRSFVNQVIVRIELDWLKEATKAANVPAGSLLYCLVVRFGTDAYLATMASKQERYQGRLINRVIEIRDDMILNLPVHRKLGTQFKLYYLTPEGEKASELWERLAEAEASLAASPDHPEQRIELDQAGPAGRKCWFRLAAYGAQEAADRFVSGYFGASQVRGFERRNRWKPWRWIRRKDQAESAPAAPASAGVPIAGDCHPQADRGEGGGVGAQDARA